MNQTSRQGDLTPLSVAVRSGFPDVAQFLIDSGADVNSRDTAGRSQLFLAAFYNNLPVMEMLIRNGASVDLTDDGGRTALHHAATLENGEILQILLQAGASVNCATRYGQTPLHMALFEGKLVNGEILIEHWRSNRSLGFCTVFSSNQMCEF